MYVGVSSSWITAGLMDVSKRSFGGAGKVHKHLPELLSGQRVDPSKPLTINEK